MGASFRNVDQILALAGCDLLTISPELLTRLAQTEGEVPAALSPQAGHDDADAVRLDGGEVAFRTQLNEDAMASEKLSEGIRLFVADARKLDALIESHGAA
ncbi:transaldolase B [Bordetella pertussis]|nr:transaldolase B [Bordetella pertussis]